MTTPSWVEASGARHAIDGPRPARGEEITALCGAVAVVGRVCVYGDPECAACDRAWRAREGIEQRDEHTAAQPAARRSRRRP